MKKLCYVEILKLCKEVVEMPYKLKAKVGSVASEKIGLIEHCFVSCFDIEVANFFNLQQLFEAHKRRSIADATEPLM